MRFEMKAAVLVTAIIMLAGCAGMAFKKASEVNSIASYEKFLVEHADSEMASEAKRRIDRLYFEKAEAAGTIAAYEAYMKQRGDSALVPEAKQRIDSLYFKQAEAAGTIAAYEDYVHQRGDSALVPEAKQRIKRLSDDKDWEAAQKSDTVEAYRQYVGKHPDSPRVHEAETRRELLEKYRGGWEAVLRKPTIPGLRHYYRQNPESPFREHAVAVIRDMEGRNIVDLLEEKKIDVESKGDGIENLTIRIRKSVSYPLVVLVPVGTYFASLREPVQDMVVIAESKVPVSAGGWKNASLAVACANKPKDVPGPNDTFSVLRAPTREDLARLMPSLGKANAGFGTRQAAVWIVTDDVNYKELGVLVTQFETPPYGSDRLIKAPETVSAMKICDDAGIDISSKRIWRDRAEILKGLPAGALKKWLISKN